MCIRDRRYAEDIVSKKVLVNIDRVLACKRFLADLERDDLDFRSDQFDFVIDLIEGTIHHVQGEDKLSLIHIWMIAACSHRIPEGLMKWLAITQSCQ